MEKQSRGSLENSEHRQSAFWVPEVKGQRDMKAEAARLLCLPPLVLTGKGDKAGRVCIPPQSCGKGLGALFLRFQVRIFLLLGEAPDSLLLCMYSGPFRLEHALTLDTQAPPGQ